MIKNQRAFLSNGWTPLFVVALYGAACGSVSVTDDTVDTPAEVEVASAEEEETFDAVKEFEEVMTHFYITHGNDLEAVITRLETLLVHAPSFVNARFNLGLIAHLTDEADEAHRHYLEALEMAPELVSPHINLGVLLAAQDNREEAQRHFEAALELEPDNWMARQNLSTLLSEDEDATEEGATRWEQEERAHAMFMVAEDTLEKAIALQVDATDDGGMQEQLREKMEVLQKAQTRYEDVVAVGNPQWSIAAIYRMGEGALHFGETIRQTHVPDRLTEEQKGYYRQHLEDNASQFDEVAINHFIMTIDAAQESGIITDYTYQAAVARFELRPEDYPEPLQLPVVGQTGPDGFVLSGFLSASPDSESPNAMPTPARTRRPTPQPQPRAPTTDDASDSPAAGESCMDWQEDWRKEERGTLTFWRPGQWRVLSPAESLALAEPIFEQTENNITLLVGDQYW